MKSLERIASITEVSKSGLINLGQYSKGWNNIPDKFRNDNNYSTFCKMNYMGLDAEAIFLNEIKRVL